MKHLLSQKYGSIIGLVLFAACLLLAAYLPASCQLRPDQQARLHAIAVPASGILSKVAIREGWISPGDEIVIQRGVAVVTSAESREVKLFQLAEIGLDAALKNELIHESDTVTVQTPTEVVITPASGPSDTSLPLIEPLPPAKPLPPAGG